GVGHPIDVRSKGFADNGQAVQLVWNCHDGNRRRSKVITLLCAADMTVFLQSGEALVTGSVCLAVFAVVRRCVTGPAAERLAEVGWVRGADQGGNFFNRQIGVTDRKSTRLHSSYVKHTYEV